MSSVTRTVARTVARAARPFRALIILVLVYELSRLTFFYLSRRHGLLQGVSVVSLGTLAFGAWVLVLRFAVLLYLPFSLVSRAARRLWWGPERP